MLFNVQNGSTVYTHRTGSQSITNVDEYLRALTPDATTGYASIYYANANGVSYSQHNNQTFGIGLMAPGPASGDNCHRPVELAARGWYCVYVSLNRVCPLWAAGDNVTLGSYSCCVPH